MRIAKLLSTFFMIFFAYSVGFSMDDQVREEFVVASISPVLEARLGAAGFEAELKTNPPSTNEVYQQTLKRISGKILENINERPDLDPEDWKFVVVKNSNINAVAYAGGKIAVYEGLIQFLTTDGVLDEEALAAIVGHEIAHVALRHSLSAIRDVNSLKWSIERLDTMDDKQRSAFLEMSKARFTRVQEFEADQHGALYAALAGFGYTGAARYMQKMIDQFGDRKIEEYVPVEQDGRFKALDHPVDSERIAGLKEFQKHLFNVAAEFQWGNQMLGNNNYDKAILCFRDVRKVFPHSFQVWNNLGKAYHLKALKQRKPNGPGFQPDLADYLTRLQDVLREPDLIQKAIEAYREARKLNPTEPGVQSNLAAALTESGNQANLAEAESILESLIATNANNPAYLNHLGIVRQLRPMAEGKESARDLFTKAATNGYLPALYNLAVLNLKTGRESEAIEGFKKYLQMDGTSPWADTARAELSVRGVEFPLSSVRNLKIDSVLGVKPGAKREDVISALGPPERTADAVTSQDDRGQILFYDTAGVRVVLSQGRVVSIHVFAPVQPAAEFASRGKLDSPMPEVAGISIGISRDELVTKLGEPDQRKDIVQGNYTVGTEYSYGNSELRIDITIQFAKIVSISVRKNT